MENEVYEKDYGEKFRERSDKAKGKDFLDTLMDVGFFQVYKEEMDKIPKRVVPKEKEDYEYLLGECDAYVRQFGGKIRGEVDYQKWQATIDLYQSHFEFCDREALTPVSYTHLDVYKRQMYSGLIPSVLATYRNSGQV